jgi:hypothetical protein
LSEDNHVGLPVKEPFKVISFYKKEPLFHCIGSLFSFFYSLLVSTVLTMVVRNAGDQPKPIIFDWDDTICPSSFVDRFQIEVFEDLPVRVSTVQLFLLDKLLLETA